jgi:hypothetical protein
LSILISLTTEPYTCARPAQENRVGSRPGDFDDITDPEVYVDSFRACTMSRGYLLKASP